MSVTLKFQSTGSIPGNGDPVQLRGPSLTIGRGNENDLVLPDPDRMLSKRHCAIEDHNGNIIVVDFSTNGTFLNYGALALGATPTPLNNGDILTVGPYEILVEILQAGAQEMIAAPEALAPVSHGFADNAPSTADLLDAPGDGGDFLDDLLSGREQLVGPGGVTREELGDDGLMPPLGEDDLMPPADDPMMDQTGKLGMHAAAGQDHFSAPRANAAPPSSGAIPDDWDDDLLAPTPSQPAAPAGDANDPFGQTAPSGGAGGAAFIPDSFEEETAEQPETVVPEPAADPEPAPPEPVAEAEPEPEPEAVAEPEPVAAPVETKPTPAPATVTKAGGGDDASRVFLKSLGAEDVPIDDAQLTSTMSRLGHVLRVMIEGMREILMTRTSIKSEFRIQQTMIQAGGNNPLKFSISADQAIEAMVRPSSKGYLDATAAAQQALQDIKAHEIAMVSGMESALKGVLKQLDPAVLEEKISDTGGISNMLKSKKSRYWEVYAAMYAEISDQAENDFQELFAREFARAYQEQLDKLK